MISIQKILAHNIKDRRFRLAFSQGRLAEKAGVSRQLLSRIEKLEREPSIGVVGKLAGALRVNYDALFRIPDQHSPDCPAGPTMDMAACRCAYGEYVASIRDQLGT